MTRTIKTDRSTIKFFVSEYSVRINGSLHVTRTLEAVDFAQEVDTRRGPGYRSAILALRGDRPILGDVSPQYVARLAPLGANDPDFRGIDCECLCDALGCVPSSL